MEELIAKYLADELGAKERADFESKLVQDESFSLEFEAYMNAWDLQNDPISSSFNTEAAWNTVQNQITETPVVEMNNSKFSFLKIAATLLVLAVAGYFIVNQTQVAEKDTNSFQVHASTASVTEAFKLPDGTVVKLNARSKISYDAEFGISNRNITLIGQADFDVERNESLPFVIEAGNGRVEVLGTSFDVAAYPGKMLKVAVTEGTVAFSSKVKEDQKAVLNQGQKAQLDTEGQKLEVSEIKDDNFKGWWTRELNFDNTPFAEAFEILERTYQVEFQYPDALKGCAYTGQYGSDDTIDNVIAVLESTFPSFTITKKENQYILEGTACPE